MEAELIPTGYTIAGLRLQSGGGEDWSEERDNAVSVQQEFILD